MSATDKVDDIYREDPADDIELDDNDEDAVEAQKELHEQQREAEAVSGVAGEDTTQDKDSLAEDEVAEAPGRREPLLDPTTPCAHCGQPMGTVRGPSTKDGPIHIGCVLEYKFLHQPRCHYCDIRFMDSEATRFVKDEATSRLYHPECRQQELKGVPYVRPSKEGEVRKFAIARSKLSRHNWKTRYFILSPMYDGIRYFEYNPHVDPKKGKDKKEASSEDSPSGDDDGTFDTDADPQLEKDHAKKAKGLVPLDRKRARLITHPAASVYKINSPAASLQNDIAIIFFDSPESNTEHRLLFQCKDKEEKQEWVRALEGYIHTVDDPKDYSTTKNTKEKKK